MSSARVQKYIQAMPEQVRRLLGIYSSSPQATLDPFGQYLIWTGRSTAGVSAGDDVGVIDFDTGAWASGHRYAIVQANVASDLNNTLAMRTQSHAQGYFIDGSVNWTLYLETPAAWTNAHAAFERAMLHHLKGQLGSPVTLMYTANGTQPTLNSVNGAGADATGTSAGTDLPALWPAPGGV
jgi:hypothetical protein